MDTLVSVHVHSAQPAEAGAAAIQRAVNWFAEVEGRCSRFDPASELVRLCNRPGEAVTVSALLFEAVTLALEVARISHGAFDPTVGATQQARGFSENYITGRRPIHAVTPACYRDLRLNRRRR